MTSSDHTTPPLMSIGMFSRASLLSVKALRAHHERGLLVPAEIDPHTGYRAYHPGQLPDAIAIRRLRELDLPLAAVESVLHRRDPEHTRLVLAQHEAAMRARLDETRLVLERLDAATTTGSGDLPVQVRDVAHTHAFAVSGTVAADAFGPFLDEAFARLRAAVEATGASPSGPGGALYAPTIHDRDDEPVTAYVPISDPGAPTIGSGVSMLELPAATVAVAIHEGDYADVGDTYAALGAWVAYHRSTVPADRPGAEVRELYLVSPADTDDPTAWRTEIHWPVEPESQHPPTTTDPRSPS